MPYVIFLQVILHVLRTIASKSSWNYMVYYFYVLGGGGGGGGEVNPPVQLHLRDDFLSTYNFSIMSLTWALILVRSSGGSVVECETWDLRVAGWRLTRGIVLCPWVRHLILCLVQEDRNSSWYVEWIVEWNKKHLHKQTHRFSWISILASLYEKFVSSKNSCKPVHQGSFPRVFATFTHDVWTYMTFRRSTDVYNR